MIRLSLHMEKIQKNNFIPYNSNFVIKTLQVLPKSIILLRRRKETRSGLLKYMTFLQPIKMLEICIKIRSSFTIACSHSEDLV